MRSKKLTKEPCNKQVKICYNNCVYVVDFDLDDIESSFKYCGESSVKTVLVEMIKLKNG